MFQKVVDLTFFVELLRIFRLEIFKITGSDEDSESGQEEIEDGTESDGNENENDEDLSMEGEADFESGSEPNSGDEQDIDEQAFLKFLTKLSYLT